MTKHILFRTTALALLLGVTAMTPATAADGGETVRTWHNDGYWQVWQNRFDNGHNACFMRGDRPTAAGKATFGISQSDTTETGMLHYYEDGINWIPGAVTLQIDYRAPWKVKADVYKQTQLSAFLGQNPAPFIAELQYGTVLHISTAAGTRNFSLIGSSAALTQLIQCVQTIASRPRMLPPEAPAVTARWL